MVAAESSSSSGNTVLIASVASVVTIAVVATIVSVVVVLVRRRRKRPVSKGGVSLTLSRMSSMGQSQNSKRSTNLRGKSRSGEVLLDSEERLQYSVMQAETKGVSLSPKEEEGKEDFQKRLQAIIGTDNQPKRKEKKFNERSEHNFQQDASPHGTCCKNEKQKSERIKDLSDIEQGRDERENKRNNKGQLKIKRPP